MIQPIERIQPENEKLIAELAESLGWRDEWLQDEELCQKQAGDAGDDDKTSPKRTPRRCSS